MLRLLILVALVLSCRQFSLGPNPPLIVEYIEPYQLAANDLKGLVGDQFARFNITAVHTSYCNFSDFSTVSAYVGNQIINKDSNLKIYVINDTMSLVIKFTALVIRSIDLRTHNTFQCTTEIKQLRFNYSKAINSISDFPVIANLNNSLKEKKFITNCVPTGKEKFTTNDSKKVDEAIVAQDGSSLYLELVKCLTPALDCMNINVRKQQISKTYSETPYMYSYYEYSIPVATSTIKIASIGNGIENDIVGTIPETSNVAKTQPAKANSFHTFYSLALADNIIQYSLKHYEKWRNVLFNRKNFASSSFHFRLIDLEFVLEGVLQDFPTDYLSEVQFRCTMSSADKATISTDDQILLFGALWTCEGILKAAQGEVLITSFGAILNYEILIFTYQDVFGVRVSKVSLREAAFQKSKYRVSNEQLAKTFIGENFGTFCTQTLGNFFRVKKGSTVVKLVEEGFWVG